MRPASALSLNQDSHEAILYSKSRGNEQGNVHVDESGDTQKERTSGFIIRNELTA